MFSFEGRKRAVALSSSLGYSSCFNWNEWKLRGIIFLNVIFNICPYFNLGHKFTTVHFFILSPPLPLKQLKAKDVFSSWRIPTVVNFPHLRFPICTNILPFHEQKENVRPTRKDAFFRDNPKDKQGYFMEAEKKKKKKRMLYVGNWMEQRRKEQSPFWESTKLLNAVGLSHRWAHRVLSVILFWVQC